MTGPKIEWRSAWHPMLGVFLLCWVVGTAVLLREPVDDFASSWPLVLVGFLGAVIGNATAVGGGIVFVPIMMLVYRVDPVTSLKMALVVQAFGMTSGAFAWARRGRFLGGGARTFQTVVATLLGGLVGTLVIAPTPLLVKSFFGPVSILIGCSLLLVRKRRSTSVSTAVAPVEELSARFWWTLWLVAFAGGLITGWVAIGVGELVAAVLILSGRFEPARAVGFGVLLLAFCSVVLALIHGAWLGGVPWQMVAFLVPGAVVGARCGPLLADLLGPRRLRIGFATVAIADGSLFLWQGLQTG